MPLFWSDTKGIPKYNCRILSVHECVYNLWFLFLLGKVFTCRQSDWEVLTIQSNQPSFRSLPIANIPSETEAIIIAHEEDAGSISSIRSIYELYYSRHNSLLWEFIMLGSLCGVVLENWDPSVCLVTSSLHSGRNWLKYSLSFS